MPDFVTGEKLTAVNLDAHVDYNRGLLDNFGFAATIDQPAAGDIEIAFKQGDDASDPTAANPVKVNFSGRQTALKLAAAKTLKIDAKDHFELDNYAANTEAFLFLYAIDRGGTLEFGVGRRPDYTRVTADFVNDEGLADDIDKVFCGAAITANDPCRVVGYLKATFNTGTREWEAVTANSLVVAPHIIPRPCLRALAKLTTNENINTGEWVNPAWDTVEFDVGGFWSADNPERFTIPRDGRYVINANVEYASAAGNASGVRRGGISMNGPTNKFVGNSRIDAAVTHGHVLSFGMTALELSAGDWFQLQLYQNSGGPVDMIAGANSWMAIYEVIE